MKYKFLQLHEISNVFLFDHFFCVVISVDGKVLKPKMKVKIDPELLQLARSRDNTHHNKLVYDFFLALATCNTIVPLISDSSDGTQKVIEYQGESPDEQALAYAAATYGFTLVERTSGHVVVDIQGERKR